MDDSLKKGLEPAEISPVSGSSRRAAVAIILCGSDDSVLFIRRAEDPRDPWSGQIALPGGRYEDKDETLMETALRETLEEVGLRLAPEMCLGQLPAVKARSRKRIDEMWVSPFVFRWDGARPKPTANYEVAELIWMPLGELTNPERKTEVQLQYEGRKMKFPAVLLGEHKLWGLTYGIMSSLLNLMPEAK